MSMQFSFLTFKTEGMIPSQGLTNSSKFKSSLKIVRFPFNWNGKRVHKYLSSFDHPVHNTGKYFGISFEQC